MNEINSSSDTFLFTNQSENIRSQQNNYRAYCYMGVAAIAAVAGLCFFNTHGAVPNESSMTQMSLEQSNALDHSDYPLIAFGETVAGVASMAVSLFGALGALGVGARESRAEQHLGMQSFAIDYSNIALYTTKNDLKKETR